METKSTGYSQVRGVKIGFGRIPPGTQPTARVERLAALGEIAVPLENPSSCVLPAGKRPGLRHRGDRDRPPWLDVQFPAVDAPIPARKPDDPRN